MNLDNFGQLLNREELKSSSPVVGVWHSRTAESEASDLILKFSDNEIFSVEGFFYFDKRKVIYDRDKYFMLEDRIKFQGNGRYFLEEDNNITISGRILAEQENCRKTYVNEILTDKEYSEKNYLRRIDFSGKFTRTEEDGKIKLIFENPDVLIIFKDEMLDDKNRCIIKGFREFVSIVEIRPVE